MSIQTGMRKAMFVAAAAGVTVAMQAPAANADTQDEPIAHCQTESGDASDMSPSTQKAWADFVCGGAHITGGAARMVSGAWFGAPAIVVAATGGELSQDQADAWKNWDRGANQGGKGVAMVISGVYVGAPGYIIDKLTGAAGDVAPSDLSAREMDQVSFIMPANGQLADQLGLGDSLPTDQLPLDQVDPATLFSLF